MQLCVAEMARQEKAWRAALQERLAEGARVWAGMEEGKVRSSPDDRRAGRASQGSYDGDSPARSSSSLAGSFQATSAFVISPRERLSPTPR